MTVDIEPMTAVDSEDESSYGLERSSGYVFVDERAASTLAYLIQTVWHSRKTIALFTAGLMLMAALVGTLSTSLYRATAIVYPVYSAPSSNLAGLASSVGLGAALNQANGVVPPTQESIAQLQSRHIQELFFEKHDVLPKLFYKRWNPETKSWLPPTRWARIVGSITGHRPTDAPTLDQAFERFRQALKVDQDEITGIISVSLDWHDPVIAAQWANELIEDTDLVMRQQKLDETERAMSYLRKEIAKPLDIARNSAVLLYTNELNDGMKVSVANNFALTMIDPARPPLRRSWPKLSLLLVLSLMGGLFLGSIGAIAGEYVRSVRQLSARGGWRHASIR